MTLVEIARLPGVADIRPVKARGLFAKAIKAEMAGNLDEAAKLLDRAIDAL